MPTYNIGGKRITTQQELSDAQIDEIASEIGATAQTSSATAPVAAQQPAPVVVQDTDILGGKKALAATPQAMKQASNFANPVGLGETALNIGTGTLASAAGGLAGLVGSVLPGEPGQGAKWVHKVQNIGTYQPRTESGKVVSGTVGQVFEGVNNASGAIGGAAGRLVGAENAGQSIGEAAPSIVGTLFGLKAPIKSFATTSYRPLTNPIPAVVSAVRNNASSLVNKPPSEIGGIMRTGLAEQNVKAAEAASSKDWQNAPRIEASKLAEKHGITLEPATSNPTLGNKAFTVAGGGSTKVSEQLARQNSNQWGNAYKKSEGIPINEPLNLKTFDKLRDTLYKPYREAAAITDITADTGVLQKLREVGVSGNLATTKAEVAAANAVGKRVAENLSGKEVVNNLGVRTLQKVDGNTVINTISDLRKEAKKVLSSPTPSSSVVNAQANAKLAIADILENQLEVSAAKVNPKLAEQIRANRVRIAQSHVAQDATNLVTGKLDATKIANQIAKGEYVTGTLEDLGKIAGNFPHVAEVKPTLMDTAKMHLYRAGPAGTAGFLLGLPGGPLSASIGGAIGAGLGEVGGMLVPKYIGSKSYQARNALPKDRRIPFKDDGMLTGTKQ